MRFSIIDRQDEHSKSIASQLETACEEKGWTCDPEEPELVFCVGGDGTLLRAIHHYLDQLDHVLFLGIHTGTLGFFTDYTDNELDRLIANLDNVPEIEEARLLEARFPGSEQTCYALNEIRIESDSRTLRLDLHIDGAFFEQSTGSGVCISSQAGSTGINRALNGAVIDAGLKVIQLCEIMPISHKNHHSLRNPFIMNDSHHITISSDNLKDAVCSYDHKKMKLDGFHTIEIFTSDKKVRFARYRPYSYLKRLKNLY